MASLIDENVKNIVNNNNNEEMDSIGDEHGELEVIKSDEDRIMKKAKRPSTRINGFVNGVHEGANGGVDKKKVTGKNSRRSRGRYGRGLAKKGGAGGKGTWGKPGSELVDVEEGLDDPHDPNYDSDSEGVVNFEAITPPLNEDDIEKYTVPIILEYFENGDTEEVIIQFEDVNLGENVHQILIHAVTLALERKCSQREMTSVLISDLYSRLLSELDIERGFDVLLKSLPDLILDTPLAATLLGNFIARAVADDCIPPKYVTSRDKGLDSPQANEAIEHANALLSMKHGLVRLDSVWGVTGGMRPVKYLIRQIHDLLKEYVVSGDAEEASRCLQELEVPHFHHEFVYEAILMVIEDTKESTMNHICALIKSLCSSAIVTIDQLKNGFNRVYEEMPDISIDVPHAYDLLAKFVGKCVAQQFLPQEVQSIPVPERGRKRFVSEGDGGLVKE